MIKDILKIDNDYLLNDERIKKKIDELIELFFTILIKKNPPFSSLPFSDISQETIEKEIEKEIKKLTNNTLKFFKQRLSIYDKELLKRDLDVLPPEKQVLLLLEFLEEVKQDTIRDYLKIIPL